MDFEFEMRSSDSPFVQTVWRTQSKQVVSFPSCAVCHWEMVVMKHQGTTTITVRGPETRVTLADSPADAEFFGVQFKLGTFMPNLPIYSLVDLTLVLPQTSKNAFTLDHSTWETPTFDNVDTFVARLVRAGLLTHDPVVQAALVGDVYGLSLRSVQRRFVRSTGLTSKVIAQIERAQQAMNLLEGGTPILDTVYELGYFDQAHLTNALKRFRGVTPSAIIRSTRA